MQEGLSNVFVLNHADFIIIILTFLCLCVSILTLIVVVKTIDLWRFMQQIRDVHFKSLIDEAKKEIQEYEKQLQGKRGKTMRGGSPYHVKSAQSGERVSND